MLTGLSTLTATNFIIFVTCEAVSITLLTATLADSIDNIGITEDNAPSGFGKTVSIFVGFFYQNA